MNHFVSDIPNYASASQGLRHIFVRDLVLDASIGIHPHERTQKQKISISLNVAVIEMDAELNANNRTIDDVVCYEALSNKIRALIARGHIELVETLAEDIANDVLGDKRILMIRVRIEKPDAIHDAAAVGVEIERRNTK